MDEREIILIMKESIRLGIDLNGGIAAEGSDLADGLSQFFEAYLGGAEPEKTTPLQLQLLQEAGEAEKVFISYYADKPEALVRYSRRIEEAQSREEKEELIARLWLPELTFDETATVTTWTLSLAEPAQVPIRPDEVTIQLNALYTNPEQEPGNLTGKLKEEWEKLHGNWGRKIADYDHPVAIFDSEEHHELLTCLEMLDADLAFEKQRQVLPPDHQVLITLSVSVTHENLDRLCSLWIEQLLNEHHFKNLTVLILTESAATAIRNELLKGEIPVYTVFGKYACHFNALKYTQLILERGYGIRAGFKLDTDEGIHSKELYDATGKTWFETLCHPYWGGSGVNWKGEQVNLAVNEGEYINSTDAESQGYPNSLRTPDVKAPASYGGPNIFFHKGFAHAGATALYNTFDNLEDFISHPVVKGGGYGITNDGLRKAHPFAFSEVGRAEDQQFYFCGLAAGIAGIFHPDLRIVHYKSSVAQAEDKTVATRFIGDMYRLIIFEALVKILGVKEAIDPMPGAFAGPLARCQAFFHTLLNSAAFAGKSNTAAAEYLTGQGLDMLAQLKKQIDSGKIEKRFFDEQRQWIRFTELAESLQPENVRKILDQFIA